MTSLKFSCKHYSNVIAVNSTCHKHFADKKKRYLEFCDWTNKTYFSWGKVEFVPSIDVMTQNAKGLTSFVYQTGR